MPIYEHILETLRKRKKFPFVSYRLYFIYFLKRHAGYFINMGIYQTRKKEQIMGVIYNRKMQELKKNRSH